MKTEKLVFKSKQDTINLAYKLASDCKKGDIITLRGTLGAGKTFFVNAFINAVLKENNEDLLDVTSPTFNLVKIYETKEFPIYHFDLYRVKDAKELYELGMEDAFERGVSLIEWPEIAKDLIKPNFVDIKIEHKEEGEERFVELIYYNK